MTKEAIPVSAAFPYDTRKTPFMASVISSHPIPNRKNRKPAISGNRKAIIKAPLNGPPKMTCHENICGDPSPKSMYTSFSSPICGPCGGSTVGNGNGAR
jgi:hypothetical protein